MSLGYPLLFSILDRALSKQFLPLFMGGVGQRVKHQVIHFDEVFRRQYPGRVGRGHNPVSGLDVSSPLTSSPGGVRTLGPRPPRAPLCNLTTEENTHYCIMLQGYHVVKNTLPAWCLR